MTLPRPFDAMLCHAQENLLLLSPGGPTLAGGQSRSQLPLQVWLRTVSKRRMEWYGWRETYILRIQDGSFGAMSYLYSCTPAGTSWAAQPLRVHHSPMW